MNGRMSNKSSQTTIRFRWPLQLNASVPTLQKVILRHSSLGYWCEQHQVSWSYYNYSSSTYLWICLSWVNLSSVARTYSSARYQNELMRFLLQLWDWCHTDWHCIVERMSHNISSYVKNSHAFCAINFLDPVLTQLRYCDVIAVVRWETGLTEYTICAAPAPHIAANI